MKKLILLLTFATMFYGCDNNGNNEELGPQHPLVGEWKLTHSGKIVDGNIEMSPYSGAYTLSFFRNGRGWEYIMVDYQLSFNWSLSDDQLIITNWKYETSIDIDPSGYEMGSDWTVLQLNSDELTVSYWMYVVFPDSDLEPYNVIRTFERVE